MSKLGKFVSAISGYYNYGTRCQNICIFESTRWAKTHFIQQLTMAKLEKLVLAISGHFNYRTRCQNIGIFESTFLILCKCNEIKEFSLKLFNKHYFEILSEIFIVNIEGLFCKQLKFHLDMQTFN